MKKHIETLKSILLAGLIFSTIFLTVQTWFYSVSSTTVPESSWLYSVLSSFVHKSQDEEYQMNLQSPDFIVARNSNYTYVNEYSSTINDDFDTLMPLLTYITPLNFTLTTEEEYSSAIKDNCIILSFTSFISTDFLSLYFDDTLSGQNINIRSVTFSQIGNDVYIYIRETDTLNIYKAKTDISIVNYSNYFYNFSGNGYSLAADSQYDYILSETPISDNGLSFYNLREIPIENIDYQLIIQTFGYNSNTIKNYREGTTSVYSENYSTLRISDNGYIEFSISDTYGGIQAYDNEFMDEIYNKYILADYAIDTSEKIIGTTLGKIETYNIYTNEKGNTVVELCRKINRISINNEYSFAKFEFSNNILISAKIQLNNYEQNKEKSYILPITQAFVLADASSLNDIRLYYSINDEYLVPSWKKYNGGV